MKDTQRQALIDKIQQLPEATVAEVEDFIDFLRFRLDRGMTQQAAQLAEPSFSKIWDNADDAAYDEL